jgi:hypothetical protein
VIKYNPAYTGEQAIVQEFLRIAAVMETLQGKMEILYSAPPRPREGQVGICDGVSWNPLGDGIKRPVWFDGVDWKAF